MRRSIVLVLEWLNFVMRKLTAFTHFAQYVVQWGLKPRPEWHDHFLDQYWQWSAPDNARWAKNDSLWVERGVFSRLVLKPGGKMLEICSGDGFNARHFYSRQVSSVLALDFDKDALAHARRFNSKPNITYIERDIRDGLPPGPFDNIVWDAAIEHFTEAEIDKIMGDIVQRLGSDGVVSGYTMVEAADGRKANALHEYEFKSKEDLRRFFTPHLAFVRVWETIYPSRHNLYFAASQKKIDLCDG